MIHAPIREDLESAPYRSGQKGSEVRILTLKIIRGQILPKKLQDLEQLLAVNTCRTPAAIATALGKIQKCCLKRAKLDHVIQFCVCGHAFKEKTFYIK